MTTTDTRASDARAAAGRIAAYTWRQAADVLETYADGRTVDTLAVWRAAQDVAGIAWQMFHHASGPDPYESRALALETVADADAVAAAVAREHYRNGDPRPLAAGA